VYPRDFAALVAAVQHNCDLADARHAADLSLCTYLLAMRELFRWQRALPLSATPERAEVGAWIAAREASWQALANDPDTDYAAPPLPAGLDLYDADGVNALLVPQRLVYGAGIERFGRPGFFLADLAYEQMRDGARVLVSDREHARGINPPPAATRGDLVLVRRDVLRRALWTRMETASRSSTAGDAFGAALAAYATDGDAAATLEQMTQRETETLVLHELGERAAARALGAQWEAMLAQMTDRRTELVVRAVRDLLADCMVTLPTLIERDADASIHFWFSLLDGFRRELAPPLRAAYAAFQAGDRAPLRNAIEPSRARFAAIADAIGVDWRNHGVNGVVARAALIAPVV
jgi:hypothetical protein